LQNQIEIGYPSIESVNNNLSINANLKKYNWFQDPRFVPTLADTNPFKDNPNAVLIDTKVAENLKYFHSQTRN
jgi:hypothetical protein